MTIGYIIFISFVILIIVYILYYFFFSIYETIIRVTPNTIKSDNKSITKITIKPINSFGKVIPFRSVYAGFNIIEGSNLIYTEHKNKKKGLIELKAKDKPGKVKIEIISKYSLFPNIVEVIIK